MFRRKQPHIRYIYFEEYNDWVPYNADKQSLCDVIKEACGRKVYGQINPGDVPIDSRYKIIFDHQDGESVWVNIYNEKQDWMR